MVGFTVLGEAAVLDDGEAEQQSVFIGRWTEEGASAVDGTEAEAAHARREG